ncbi:transcriptional regulator [Diaphorobacter nitroreducens]|uniref:MucB/RseB C-terminal domain-containing protein n=1 Tax=Diaphorobacter nitroreducens TaxID=164759 RepID=UPI000B59D2DF|nr:transcriptional regulator [Diaphorobacter nitroreducens]
MQCCRRLRSWWLVCGGLMLCGVAAANCMSGPAPTTPGEPRDVAEWVARMHHASLFRSYRGTFVVLSSNGAMVSSRIWHACEGARQIERVEALSGTPRVVFRREEEVRTFLPHARVVRSELRDVPGAFPRVADAKGVHPSQHYALRALGQERVAGRDADRLLFQPRDAWRFGYQIWVDRVSGLVVKMQTLDGEGRLLEQAAFSELNLDVPADLSSIEQMMEDLQGYRLVKVPLQRTTAEAQGWTMGKAVTGFVSQGCYRKDVMAMASGPLLQCIYSDGLATLSVFVEPFDAARHAASVRSASMGATQVVGRQVHKTAWVTAVGEVPARTLQRFIESVQRKGE